MKPNYPRLIVEIRPSRILLDEVGLFAVRKIKAGEVIVSGSVFDESIFLSWDEWRQLDKLTRDKLYAFCPGDEIGIHVPPDLNTIPICWYINHSCCPNAIFTEVGDLVAVKMIKKNSEITWDYSTLEQNPKFKMPCRCGKSNCRGIIRNLSKKQIITRENNELSNPSC